ncbi:MAG: hypothetical protein VX833_03255 [Actinomycetota bacterium]|nr:hypothetical protein [Actinomycetota bacterium]
MTDLWLLAHGMGGRLDLPLSRWQVAWAASVALVFSFVALGLLWHRPQLRTAAAGRALGAWIRRPLDLLGALGRIVAMAIFIVVVSAGFLGQDNTVANIGPVTVFIIFWIGIPVASVLFGDVWRAVSPWETLGRLVDRIRPLVDREIPGWLASGWAALAPISVFHWFELAYHDGASPRVLGWWALIYTVGLLAAAWRWGWTATRRAEGFGVLFGALARLAPVRRDTERSIHTDHQLRLRWPWIGVTEIDTTPAVLAVILAALGGTAFDGVSRTRFWSDITVGRAGWELTLVNTIGLVWVVALVGVAYHLAGRLGGRMTGERRFADRFGISLVPILLGYDLAHYFSLLLLEGQAFKVLASDPYGEGWNLFGTAEDAINWMLISPTAIGWVQITSIVVGHLVGVLVAHDRAVETFEQPVALRSQYPMLAVMVLYTMFGLVLMTG